MSHDAVGELEGVRMADLERAARSRWSAACFWIASTIGLAVVAGVEAPQAREAVEDAASVGRRNACPWRATMRGAVLNGRLAVNGIQKA